MEMSPPDQHVSASIALWYLGCSLYAAVASRRMRSAQLRAAHLQFAPFFFLLACCPHGFNLYLHDNWRAHYHERGALASKFEDLQLFCLNWFILLLLDILDLPRTDLLEPRRRAVLWRTDRPVAWLG